MYCNDIKRNKAETVVCVCVCVTFRTFGWAAQSGSAAAGAGEWLRKLPWRIVYVLCRHSYKALGKRIVENAQMEGAGQRGG